MVLKDISLLLNKQNPVYFPGETVSGYLKFFAHSSKEVKVTEIYIKFNGTAKVSWSVSDSTGDSSDTTTYSSNENYFKLKYEILKATDLLPGQHTYKFSFYLPNQIPSTFKGSHGDVTYMLKVRARIPWKLTYKYEFPIQVVANFNVNNFPLLNLPRRMFLEKTYSSCCSAGETNLEITFPKTIYRCGEMIQVTLDLDNRSNVTVKDVVFKLRKSVEFISNFPRTLKNKNILTVQKLHTQAITGGVAKKFIYIIPIPNDLEIYDLSYCSIINFSYILFVTVKLGGCIKLKDSIPLLILNN